MAEIYGWVPLHGRGQAIPIIRMVNPYDWEDIANTVTDKVYIHSFTTAVAVESFPSTLAEQIETYKYTIHNKNGDVIAGVSNILIGSASSDIYVRIYGTNYGYSPGVGGTIFSGLSGSVWPVERILEHLRKCSMYIIYNPSSLHDDTTLWTLNPPSAAQASSLASGRLGYLSDLEWYPTREEAIANSFPADPYNPGGNSGPAGGNGNFGNDRANDDLRPLIPSGSVENDLVDAGIFTRYLVTNEQLKEFAKELFTDDFSSALLREIVELMFGKVYDALISVMSYPFAVAELPGITLKASDIHLGSFDTNAASTGILTKTFTQIDWGNVDINEYWGNFLDYAPHTKIQLFLPWGTGFVDIDPNECMGTSLNVVTNIELSKGTCVHIVTTGNGAILGTYNGFCGSQYPITAVDTSGKAISTVIGAVAAVTSIGAGALGKGAAESAYISAANKPTPVGLSFEDRLAHQKRVGKAAAVVAAKPYQAISKASAATAATSSLAAARLPVHFHRNGSFAANASSMMPQKPFLIMTWPDQSVPSQYGSHVGYPSNIYENLGRLRGYTEVGAVHLDGINCTEHEREEIMSLLQGGVIL